MRHFIGGFSLGLLVALYTFDKSKLNTWWDIRIFLSAVAVVGLFFGLAAWGLMP